MKQRALLLLYSVFYSFDSSFLLCVGVCPGYSGFDSYNGFNNYCFGNGMFDERVRGERGGRGKVQNCFPRQLLSIPTERQKNSIEVVTFHIVM